MARPEAGLWEFLRARTPVGTHSSRIESHDTCPGFPDVHLTYQATTWGWELKVSESPNAIYPFKDDKGGLRKAQRIWIEAEIAAGGHVMLVLECAKRIYFVPGMYWSKLNRMTIAEISRASLLTWERGGNCDVLALADILWRAF